MAKILKISVSLIMVSLMVTVLFVGCGGDSGSSSSSPTTTKESTSTTEPKSNVTIEDTTYDANKEFSKTNADDPDTVWSYMYTIDSGENYQVNTIYNEQYNTWYPVGEMWFGAGINIAENAGEFEVIADTNTMWSALTFTAPADGTFTIQPFEVFSPFNEPAHIFKVMANKEVKFESEPGALKTEDGEEMKKVSVPEITVELKKGETIRFHGQGEGNNSFACYDMSQVKIDAKY